MGLEFGCARGDCSFLVRGDDRDEIAAKAEDHLQRTHQVPADEYDVEEDISVTESDADAE